MNPVQSLQHMLNHLARTYPNLLRLAETGTFDEPTLEAVMIFQRDFGLPVTGIVDQATWDAITAAYFQNLLQFGPPAPLYAFPDGTSSVNAGEEAAELLIAQAMLTALQDIVANFEAMTLNSINAEGTHQNLRHLQSLAHMPVDGTLDRATWSVLAHLYRALVTRNAYRTFPL